VSSEKRAELIDTLAAELAVPALSREEVESLLSLAGAAAHGTGDRTSAPLVTFLAGMAAAGGEDRGAAIERLRARTAEIAPED
jgi:Domain of unknown function (DUF6457)